MEALGKETLGVIFAVGGVVAAIAGAVAGVRIILASATGSGYALGQAISSLVVVGIGLGLMIGGPEIAGQVVRTVGARAGVASIGGAWDVATYRILAALMQLGAVIAAVGIAWNGVLMILDALFGASPEPSPVALNRILAISLLLGLLLVAPGVTERVFWLLSGAIR